MSEERIYTERTMAAMVRDRDYYCNQNSNNHKRVIELQAELAEAKEDDSEGTIPLAVLDQIVRLQAELEAESKLAEIKTASCNESNAKVEELQAEIEQGKECNSCLKDQLKNGEHQCSVHTDGCEVDGLTKQLQTKLAHVSDLETLYRKGWDAAAGNVVLLQAELDKLRWIPVDADKDNELKIGQYIWAYNPKFKPSTFVTVYTGDELDINYTHWMLATPPEKPKPENSHE